MGNETTRQAWEVRLREQAASGLDIKAWCEREGVTASSFHYWRKRSASAACDGVDLPLTM